MDEWERATPIGHNAADKFRRLPRLTARPTQPARLSAQALKSAQATFVVYNGTDTTVTVTGLTANSAYTVGVWEYNGLKSGTQNYNPNSGLNLVPFYTMTTAPTISPSNLTISSPTPTSVSLNFTAGNGNQRIVLARLYSSPSATIDNFDGQTLTPSTSFGNGTDLGNGNFVVYRGSGSSTFVLGLSNATTYNFRVYELNVGGSGSENYLGTVSSQNNIDQATLAAAPTTQASSVTVSNPSTNALTIRWQNGNGARRLVVASQQFFTDAPTNGVAPLTSNPVFGQGDTMRAGIFAVANTATVDSVRVTGLQPNTVYYFRVYEYNGSSATTSYNTSTTANGTSRTTLTSEPTVNSRTSRRSIAPIPLSPCAGQTATAHNA